MLVLITAVLAFVTIAGLGFAFVGGGGPSSAEVKRTKAIAQRSTSRPEVQKRERADPEKRRKAIMKSLKEQERQQRKATVSLASRIQQAGLPLTVRKFWIVCIILGIVIAGALMVLGFKPLIAIALGFGGGLGVPRWVVGFLAKRRAAKFVAAFPDATDIIVRGIKSGLPLHDCLKIIGKEAPEPLGAEFRRLVENMGMGMEVGQALDKLYERMPLAELRFFTIVLAVQQKAGGNLAEALGNLSGVLRARKMMREKIKALSGEAVASAGIIGSLPPAVIILISITTPSYMASMFTDPRGHLMLMVGAFWMSCGIFVMRKMINFQF
jgi:tight adherence protein B